MSPQCTQCGKFDGFIRFPDILSQDTFCPGTIFLAKIRCSWLLMGVDGATFCPGYVFTGKTYCPRTKCHTEILLLALPFQPIGAQFIISSS